MPKTRQFIKNRNIFDSLFQVLGSLRASHHMPDEGVMLYLNTVAGILWSDRAGRPLGQSILSSKTCNTMLIPFYPQYIQATITLNISKTVVVWIKMAPVDWCLATRKWHYLRGLGSVVSLEWTWPLLEEVSRWGWALRLVDSDVEPAAPSPAACLPVSHHAPYHGNGLNLWNCEPTATKYFPL